MATVYIVDDDARVVKALSRLMRVNGYEVRPYTSPREFLADHDGAVPGCVVLDLSMPELDGFALQQFLAADGSPRPVIFLTGKGDIPSSVRAMRAGAVDFLTKPVSNADLLAAIARAVQQDIEFRRIDAELSSIRDRMATLTPREREVLTHVAAGRLSKQIAYDLGTVEKTIKFHRSSIMRKLGVRTIADLVRMTEKVGLANR